MQGPRLQETEGGGTVTLDDPRQAALHYARWGWAIVPIHKAGPDGSCTCGKVPCPSPGKHPRTEHGLDDGTSNAGKIREWFDRWPDSNLGVVTGKGTGIFVVDVDKKSGGFESLNALEKEYGKIPDTRIHKTGGGGVHLFFSIPRGKKIPCSESEIAPGIDIKGERGIIVLPPSVHSSGERYEVVSDMPIADPPDWLIDLILKKKDKKAGKSGFKMPDTIQEGKRAKVLFSLSRSLCMKGLSPEAALAAVQAENSARCTPPLPENEVHDLVRSAFSDKYEKGVPPGGLSREGPRGRMFLDHGQIADQIHRKFNTLVFNGEIWIYDPEKGTYRRNAGEIQAEFKQICENLEFMESITREMKDVLFHLLTLNRHLEYPFNKVPGLIPVRNGVIRVSPEGVDLLPHSPGYRFTFQLPVRYDDKVNTAPIFSILEEWAGEEKEYLIQIPAQSFLQAWGNVYKAAYLLLGPPDAGKTSYVELLTSFVGKENVSRVGLHAMCGSRFATSSLVGKLVNIEDDLPAVPLSLVGAFKILTGGQELEVERKHSPQFNATLTAVQIFTANQPPELTRDIEDAGFWSRWNILLFGNKFPVNPDWKTELLKEENLSAFLLVVVKRIQEIQGGAFMRMNPEEMKTLWTGASSSITGFYTDYLKKDPSGFLLKEEAYASYQEYAGRKKLPIETKTAFTLKMQQMGVVSTQEPSGKRRRIYKGITWKLPEGNPFKSFVENEKDQSMNDLNDFFFTYRTGGKKSTIEDNTSRAPVRICSGKPVHVVRILHDLEPFQGIDGQEYECHKEELVTLPLENALVLIERGVAVLVTPREEPREGHTPSSIFPPVKPVRFQEEIG